MQPLVVVDLSVWLHLLYARMGGDSGVRVPRSATDAAYVPVWKSAHRDGIIKAQLALLLGASYMGASSHDVVLVGDYKPYWRSEYLKRPETVAYQMTFKKAKDAALQTQVREAIEAGKALPEGWERLTVAYKGGRKFPEYRFNWLRTYVRNLLQEQGIHLWASEGYEADDYAAAFVRSAVARDRPMTLLTVDTDWLGLVSSDVQWVCMSGFSPRIRQGLAGLNAWAEARLGATFDTPTDLWEYKAKHGDKSDNLPAGSPIGVIDLLNPAIGLPLSEARAVHGRVGRSEVNPYATRVEEAERYLLTLGVMPVVRPISEEDTKEAARIRDSDSKSVDTLCPVAL